MDFVEPWHDGGPLLTVGRGGYIHGSGVSNLVYFINMQRFSAPLAQRDELLTFRNRLSYNRPHCSIFRGGSAVGLGQMGGGLCEASKALRDCDKQP